MLVSRVEHLSFQVEELLRRLPNPAKEWVDPGELAKLFGCSVRTVGSYRQKGWIQPANYRRASKGFQYHRDHALADMERNRPPAQRKHADAPAAA